MKVVFYNCLFGSNYFQEPTDKIIYSYLVYKSFSYIDGVFSTNVDEFDYSVVSEYLSLNDSSEFCEISQYKIAKDLSMSINTVKSRMSEMQKDGLLYRDQCGYITINYIPELKDSFYFPLIFKSKLKGEVLIVYSFLKHKCKGCHGYISTFDVTQAKELSIGRKYYQKILCELYKKNLAERLPDGRLKVN